MEARLRAALECNTERLAVKAPLSRAPCVGCTSAVKWVLLHPLHCMHLLALQITCFDLFAFFFS